MKQRLSQEDSLDTLTSASIAFAQVMIAVVSVPDTPEIVLPASPVVEEDKELIISGLGMYDADVSRPGDEDLLFNVWLEAVSGRLSVNGSMVSLAEIVIYADEFTTRSTRLS